MFEKIINAIGLEFLLNKLKKYLSKIDLKERQDEARQRIGDIRKDVLVGKDIPKYVPEFYLECKNTLPPHDSDLQYLKHLNDSLAKKPAARRNPAAKRKPAARKVPPKK